MANRKSIPPSSELDVLFQSRRRCCLCFGLNGDFEEKRGQLAHLDRNNSNNQLDNLAFLCLEHHDIYDSKTSQSKGWRENEVKKYRDMLYAEIQRMFAERLDSTPLETFKSKVWEYYPLSCHYLNLPRLLAIYASFSSSPLITSPAVDSIRQLNYVDYHSLIAFATRLLKDWHPKVLNPHNAQNFRQNNLGCAFEYSFADFRTKNVKFWDKNHPKPRMHGLIEKDPHIYYKLGDLTIFLPLDYSWITTDTAFLHFRPGNGRIEGLSGLAVLKFLGENSAVLTPLLLGTFNAMEAMEKSAGLTFEIPYSWRYPKN
jgi:hypothetical protein